MSNDLNIPDEYLGDGVYASFDGWHIWLDLRQQETSPGTSRIALDPSVLRKLDEYRAFISAAVEEKQRNESEAISGGDDPSPD